MGDRFEAAQLASQSPKARPATGWICFSFSLHSTRTTSCERSWVRRPWSIVALPPDKNPVAFKALRSLRTPRNKAICISTPIEFLHRVTPRQLETSYSLLAFLCEFPPISFRVILFKQEASLGQTKFVLYLLRFYLGR